MSVKTTETLTRKQAIDKIVEIQLESLKKLIILSVCNLTNKELENKLEEYEESKFINYSVVGGDDNDNNR